MSNGVATGSFVGGLFRVFEAGERLLVEHAELIRLDSRERIASAAARVGLVALAAACLFTAWLGVLATLVVAFEDLAPLSVRLGCAAGAQAALGVGLLIAARRSREAERADRA